MNPYLIIDTADGSPTVIHTTLGVTYHSRFGALAESRHIYIDNGFRKALGNDRPELRILEMGFGTGLNAWLTCEAAKHAERKVKYYTIEKFPLPAAIWNHLDYTDRTVSERAEFRLLHELAWNASSAVGPGFVLSKIQGDILETDLPAADIIYYDAFDPSAQPELWTTAIFQKLYAALSPGGFLVTYCAKGVVKRSLKEAGFKIEGFAGPPGKRECTRAVKNV